MKKSRITVKSCESMDIRKHRFVPKMDTSTRAMKSMKDKERERERRNWNQRLRNGEYDDYEDDDFEEYDESSCNDINDVISVCDDIYGKKHLTYDEVDKRLRKVGFKLDEYGGERKPYAIYIHPCGVIATVDYGMVKSIRGRDSYVSGIVTDFNYDVPMEYDESINNDDEDSDDGDSYPFTVTDIDWDTDGEDASELNLPETLVVDVPMECVDNGSAEVEDYISDYLSDTYGFCHNGFSVEGLDDEQMDESKKNEDWFGIKNAKFIYHGDWNDPEVQYDGVSLNYYDIEDILLDEYREEHPEDKNDKGFDKWMALPKTKSSIQSALDILVQCGAGKPIE